MCVHVHVYMWGSFVGDDHDELVRKLPSFLPLFIHSFIPLFVCLFVYFYYFIPFDDVCLLLLS